MQNKITYIPYLLDEKDIVDEMKTYIESLFNSSLDDFKDQISAGIFSLELSILYKNKVYDQRVGEIQNVFTKLSEDIDDNLSYHAEKCFEKILQSLDNLRFDPKLSDILNKNKVTN